MVTCWNAAGATGDTYCCATGTVKLGMTWYAGWTKDVAGRFTSGCISDTTDSVSSDSSLPAFVFFTARFFFLFGHICRQANTKHIRANIASKAPNRPHIKPLEPADDCDEAPGRLLLPEDPELLPTPEDALLAGFAVVVVVVAATVVVNGGQKC